MWCHIVSCRVVVCSVAEADMALFGELVGLDARPSMYRVGGDTEMQRLLEALMIKQAHLERLE